jgi:ligand-binding SRPBCC domain-containing protein
MKYRHQFRVRAPLTAVAEFHTQSASMGAITPPPIIVRITHAPARVMEGDEMAFTMWLGPVPLKWVSHIDNVSGQGFSDRQVNGPFQDWTHRHTFAALSEATTEVRDEVQARLRKHVLWGPLGLAMWLGLPLLFAYRSRQTRRLLESKT